MNPADTDPPPVVCAVDVGSTFIKAAVYDGGLRVLAQARGDFPAVRDGDRAEAEPELMWRAFADVVARVVASAPNPPGILAISSQMAGLVLLDGWSRPLGRCILGVDRRGEGYEQALDPRTGCPPGGIYPAGKLAWLAAHEPDRIAAASRIGGVKEYLVHRLTGQWVTDPSSASTTGLYDLDRAEWWPAAVRASGAVPDALPTVRPPGTVIGPAGEAAAQECGLSAGVSVLNGLGDGPAANLACGAIGGQRLCLSLGTTIVARLLVSGRDLAGCRVPLFVQHVDGDRHCLGLRLDPTGDGRTYRPVGAPDVRLALADLPEVLAGLLDRYGVTELRPVGAGCRDHDLLRRLAGDWALPVRLTDAADGTRGVAALALSGTTGRDLESLVERVPVRAEFWPESK